MRPRIRELITDLETAGFHHRKSQGKDQDIHHFFRHPAGINLTVLGGPGDVAKFYIINDIRNALELIDNERF